ncbi:MAG: HEPN domain-containing protein [Candidatus Latescibacteria bacterium]|nr:HEPN domain-containing protein [Candidatus Latescibacterota bacterium]MCK5733344.1 HEPN domain-containing protein [Candidatus Latescibacterota bacterium]
MKEQTQHWINHAEYDLDTAEAMFRTGRYLYVAFMGQQTIEKILKGFIVEWKDTYPPYSHNLRRLAEISGIDAEMSDEQLKLLDDLTPFCVMTRYPAYKEKMAAIATLDRSKEYLSRTKEMFRWLRQKIN